MNGGRGTGTRGNRRGRSRGAGLPRGSPEPGTGGTGDRRAARWTPGIGGAPANRGARSSGEHRAAGARGRCGAALGRRRTAPGRPGEGPYGGGPRAGGGLTGEPQVSPGLRRRRGLGGEARGDWPGAFLGRGSRMGGPCCPRGLKTSVAVGRPGGAGLVRRGPRGACPVTGGAPVGLGCHGEAPVAGGPRVCTARGPTRGARGCPGRTRDGSPAWGGPWGGVPEGRPGGTGSPRARGLGAGAGGLVRGPGKRGLGGVG